MDHYDDDMESAGANSYSDVEDIGGDDDVEDTEGHDDEGRLHEEDIIQSQKGYVVLKEEDIRRHQRDDIGRVSTAFSISQVEAIALLLHYHWHFGKFEEEWFSDEERVREAVGILKEPVVDVHGQKLIQCGICFESYTSGEIARVSCGHPYCITCWAGYITTKIESGPGCLRIKCPEPSCSAAVGQDLIVKVSKVEDKEKYYRYLLRSYVEENVGRIKWCPSPGCECAIDYGDGGTGSSETSSYDITCLCSQSFCWNCSELDAHSPVDCETVLKWTSKNEDESGNRDWIVANSKPCPKCNRPIEKNDGCNHMTCSSPCKHQFCWICLKPYKDHLACNRFVHDQTEDTRKSIQNEIVRYTHYYLRWATNQSSRLKAMSDLEILQSVQLKELSDTQGKPETEFEFIVEAWHQIIECRRFLKWTYVYGFYLPPREHAKKELFEYLQGDAESSLDRLHHCVETELKQFIHKTDADSTKKFDSFRKKLIDLTSVTKKFFENLVTALENDLADVTHKGN
ncbi:hypothetical protein CARUB_v10025372mg, partial [Capsella rubella]